MHLPAALNAQRTHTAHTCEPEDPCGPASQPSFSLPGCVASGTALGFSLTYSPKELNLPPPKAPPRLLLRTLPAPLGARSLRQGLVTFRMKRRQNRGGEQIQNREQRHVKEARKTHFALSSPGTAPLPECLLRFPEPWGLGPREQPRLRGRKRRHLWGTEVPPEHSHAPAQQEAVGESFPTGVVAPHVPGSSKLPYLHEDGSPARRRVATHLSPAVPPRAEPTRWSFSASVSTSAASRCHQLIHCAKQHLYIESCSHAG